MTSENQYNLKNMQAIGDGSSRRIKQGETEYKPFEKKNTGELIGNHGYLGMLCDAQSNIRVAIEGLKQNMDLLGVCEKLITLELDIELSLVKLKNIALGRHDIN